MSTNGLFSGDVVAYLELLKSTQCFHFLLQEKSMLLLYHKGFVFRQNVIYDVEEVLIFQVSLLHRVSFSITLNSQFSYSTCSKAFAHTQEAPEILVICSLL